MREVKEKAARLVAQGQFARAEVLLRQVLTQTPRDAQAWLKHAEVLKRLSRPADAVASYRLAARILDDEGHHPRAAAALKLALSLLPDDIDLITDIIRSEMKTRRGQAAVRSVFPISSPSQLLATVPASSASSIARDAEGVQLALPSAPVAGAAPALGDQHPGPTAPTSAAAQAGSASEDVATASGGANPPTFADTREASPTDHSAGGRATASEGAGTEAFGSASARRSGAPAELLAGEPPSERLTEDDAPASRSYRPGAPDTGLASRTGPPDELALGNATARRSGAPADPLAGEPFGRLTHGDAPEGGSSRSDAGLASAERPPDGAGVGLTHTGVLGGGLADRARSPDRAASDVRDGGTLGVGFPERGTPHDAAARVTEARSFSAGRVDGEAPRDTPTSGKTRVGQHGAGLDTGKAPHDGAHSGGHAGAPGEGFRPGGSAHESGAGLAHGSADAASSVTLGGDGATHDRAASAGTHERAFGAGLAHGSADAASSVTLGGDGATHDRAASAGTHDGGFGGGLTRGIADAASSGAFEEESATHERTASAVTGDGVFAPEVHVGHAASADPFELLVNDVRARVRDAGATGAGTGVGAPGEALASGAGAELALEVHAGPDEWPQVRRLSARSVAIRAAPGARWVVVSGDLLEVRFADELDVPEDAEWLE